VPPHVSGATVPRAVPIKAIINASMSPSVTSAKETRAELEKNLGF